MEKKKILLLVFILIDIVFITGCIIYFYPSSKDKSETIIGDFKRELLGRVTICTRCPLPNSFPYYVVTHSNKDIQEKLNVMNKEAEKKYAKAVKSKNNCKKKMNGYTYNYGKYAISDYNFYENKDYISMAYTFHEADNCEDELTSTKPVAYIYSKKKKDFLTNEEFMEENNLDIEAVHNYIESYTISLNSTMDTDYSVDQLINNGEEDYSFYYTKDGVLAIYFYQSSTDEYLSLET